MLVLTRRAKQSIVIGDGIVVTVLDIKGDQIRLGIHAPRHVPVYREELLRAVSDANVAAVLPDDANAPALLAPRPAVESTAGATRGMARAQGRVA